MSAVGHPSSDFEKLLTSLKSSRGFDFLAYKQSTLQRRILKRISQVGVAEYSDYLDYLEVHQDEYRHLFNTILINVTSFFRDAEAWEYLRSEIIPRLLAAKPADEPLRAWVAGCASGEEAYSLSMVLAEAMGLEAFRSRVKIYATDLDDEALTASRIGAYSERETESVPAELKAKYFEFVNGKYLFDRELRRAVIFGRHDLIQDAPISKVDLLLCRNTLMYFNAETQGRIVSRFHFALTDGGYLFLGKAETLLSHPTLFSPLDLRHRVFAKVKGGRGRDRNFFVSSDDLEGNGNETDLGTQIRDAAFEHSPTAHLVLDQSGSLVLANLRARNLFSVSTRDLGRPIQDLEVSYRPVELRSGIEQACRQRRAVSHKEITFSSQNGESFVLNIQISPLIGDSTSVIGVSILFEDVTDFRRLQSELINFNQELETAYEEVQSTNEELQTTNEELQSTVEELETTNEELQSTNEELETMNEELHSSNEEFETVNEELRTTSGELNKTNLFLESILACLRDGVIVLDVDFRILSWNKRSEDLWGMRSDEVLGKHLLNLDLGLPVEQLRAPMRACVSKSEPQYKSVDAINRKGKPIMCDIVLTPLTSSDGNQQGLILICEPSVD